jgi:hypothetical protein
VIATGLRQWIVVFLTVRAGDQAGVAAHAWIIPVVGALISFLGVTAGLIGNELSIRYGLRTIATLVFLLSVLAGGLLGFTAMLSYISRRLQPPPSAQRAGVGYRAQPSYEQCFGIAHAAEPAVGRVLAAAAAAESWQKARVIVDDDREGSFTSARSNRPTFPFCLL